MKAKYNGRTIQVEKIRRADVLFGGKIINRVIYRDDNDHRYIKRRDNSLRLVRLREVDDGNIWNCNYEIM